MAIYSFDHFHSNTYKVLGVFKGVAKLKIGESKGKIIKIKIGDIIIIPAGISINNLSFSEDFTVLKAYHNESSLDFHKKNQKNKQ